jgi:hypothetical protein
MGRCAFFLALVILSFAAIGQTANNEKVGKPAAVPRAVNWGLSGANEARDWKLVYTRQPRATKPIPGTPVGEAANWQHASDVGRINGGMAEADVVIDDLDGHVKVIHNCTRAKRICVAHEARVSPDGTKIVYSVGKGGALREVQYLGVKMGIHDIPG